MHMVAVYVNGSGEARIFWIRKIWPGRAEGTSRPEVEAQAREAALVYVAVVGVTAEAA